MRHTADTTQRIDIDRKVDQGPPLVVFDPNDERGGDRSKSEELKDDEAGAVVGGLGDLNMRNEMS